MKNTKVLKTTSEVILKVASVTANQTCPFIFGQPKFPEAAKRLRKF